ncbi:MAG: hypothetical protein ACJ8DI_01370 [Ktedonobacteraceae bacterium]
MSKQVTWFTSVARNSRESCALHESKPEKQGNWCLYSEFGSAHAGSQPLKVSERLAKYHRLILTTNDCPTTMLVWQTLLPTLVDYT